MESGAPRRDTPDNEDFEGEGRESEQLPEEAPSDVKPSSGRERAGGAEKSAGAGERGERGEAR